MTTRDQIEAIDQRLTGVEVRTDRLEEYIGSINRLEKAYMYAKATIAIVPMIAGVLMFLDWYHSEAADVHQPPVLVDTVCEYCLYDFADAEWHCMDCVVLEVVE